MGVTPSLKLFRKAWVIFEGLKIDKFGCQIRAVWPDDGFQFGVYVKFGKFFVIRQLREHAALHDFGKVSNTVFAIVECHINAEITYGRGLDNMQKHHVDLNAP